MAKKKKNLKRLHRSTEKSCKGFWIRWSDVDPLANIDSPTKVQVGSTNPVVHLRLKNDQFWHDLRFILDGKRFRWLITIEMDFEKGSDIEVKPREIEGVARLPDLTDIYEETLESMFQDAVDKNYIDKYVTTRIHQQVLSGQSIGKEY